VLSQDDLEANRLKLIVRFAHGRTTRDYYTTPLPFPGCGTVGTLLKFITDWFREEELPNLCLLGPEGSLDATEMASRVLVRGEKYSMGFGTSGGQIPIDVYFEYPERPPQLETVI
jgi:hypothetical protein